MLFILFIISAMTWLLSIGYHMQSQYCVFYFICCPILYAKLFIYDVLASAELSALAASFSYSKIVLAPSTILTAHTGLVLSYIHASISKSLATLVAFHFYTLCLTAVLSSPICNMSIANCFSFTSLAIFSSYISYSLSTSRKVLS